jgi:glucan phosphoethanolaminetransferase (alkaline phosphatase superfamily)
MSSVYFVDINFHCRLFIPLFNMSVFVFFRTLKFFFHIFPHLNFSFLHRYLILLSYIVFVSRLHIPFSHSVTLLLFFFFSLMYQHQFTDIKTAAAFTKDVKEVGYGTMRINNYRKNGEVFNASITVFPIYDSVIAGEVPVLTHFATLLNDVR